MPEHYTGHGWLRAQLPDPKWPNQARLAVQFVLNLTPLEVVIPASSQALGPVQVLPHVHRQFEPPAHQRRL